jgi:hypothetical protein
MAKSYELITSQTVGALGAVSVTLSSIPQTYTDLKVLISGRSTSWGYSYNNLYVTINGAPSGTEYSDTNVFSVGTSAGSFAHNGQNQPWTAATPSTAGTASTFGNIEIYIPNYSGSTSKSISTDGVTERNSSTNGDVFLNFMAGLKANSAAVTSLVFTTDVTAFEQYSTFYLYGIEKE